MKKITGDKFQESFKNDLSKVNKNTNHELSFDLFGVSHKEVKDIDSKNKINNIDRKIIKCEYIKLKKIKIPGLNCCSAYRGDLLITNFNNFIIADVKNYYDINNIMKFPKDLNKKNFFKGVDSNIKPLIFCELLNIPILNNLFKSESDFNKIKNNFSLLTKIGKITREKCIDIISFSEIGYAYKEKQLENIKYFLSKSDSSDDILFLKKLDINNFVNCDYITVKMRIDDNGYTYIYFCDDKDECIYVLSQRKYNKKHGFVGNCSFLCRNIVPEIVVDLSSYA